MWKDVKGHSLIADLLKSYSASGNIPHAFLFAGIAGQGKTRMAREFFKAVNCLEHKGEGCDRCRSCLKVIANTHPDLVQVNPSSKWIKVDEVRQILSEVGFRPYEARMKFIVIEPAEYLNTEGANALLKTLEEPPSGTVIVLISHRPKLLLPTIISRCQLIRFSSEEVPGVSRDGQDHRQQVDMPFETAEAEALRKDIISLLSGAEPAWLARKYFDEEGWDILPTALVIVESVLRDIMTLRHGSDRVMNLELRKMQFRHADISALEDIAHLVRAIRHGVNENINLRVAATELFISLSRLAWA